MAMADSASRIEGACSSCLPYRHTETFVIKYLTCQGVLDMATVVARHDCWTKSISAGHDLN